MIYFEKKKFDIILIKNGNFFGQKVFNYYFYYKLFTIKYFINKCLGHPLAKPIKKEGKKYL